MGDKYKLLPEILPLFPKKINRFIEPFLGGGSVYLNVAASSYLLNDIDENIIGLQKFLLDSSTEPEKFFKAITKIVKKYGLSRSYIEDIVPAKLRQKYIKTYYAHFNKPGYLKLRNDFNKKTKIDFYELYILLIYGFNRILRFNSEGKFNLPVGNVDFNNNTKNALNNFFEITRNRNIDFHTEDFLAFLKKIKFRKDDFVYLDPPYLITFGEYNKFWNDQREADLLDCLDWLSEKKVNWALSNVTDYEKRGENLENKLLKKWMKNYDVKEINSNYISFHNNTQKKIKEILVKNF